MLSRLTEAEEHIQSTYYSKLIKFVRRKDLKHDKVYQREVIDMYRTLGANKYRFSTSVLPDLQQIESYDQSVMGLL